MIKRLALFFILISINTVVAQNISVTLQISDSTTNQILQDVLIQNNNTNKEFTSNYYGLISLKIVLNENTNLVFNKQGYKLKQIFLNATKDTAIIVLLIPNTLPEVIISGDSSSSIRSDSRATLITKNELDKIPLLMGEKDIIRSLQLLPGVQNANEASSGLYVRGGSADQNQFILDDVNLYNVNHLFGFVSVFNPEILKEAMFYKGDFPARYGGKLSSVVDIRTLDGNSKQYLGGFSINPVSAKFKIEGPIKKEKVSFIVAGRRSFLDFMSSPLFKDISDYGLYNFYDLNIKMNAVLNDKNRIFLSFYNGRDKFSDHINSNNKNSENFLKWGNTGISLRWNKIWHKTVFTNTSLVGSEYNFISQIVDMNSNGLVNAEIKYSSNIVTYTAKTEADWFPSNCYQVKVGIGMDFNQMNPGITETVANGQTYTNEKSYNPTELYSFIENKILFGKKLNLNLGFRYSNFKNQINFHSYEPRVSITYLINKNQNIRLAYTKSSQPLHQLTNTGIGIPTDLWVPSINNFKPEQGDLLTLGYTHNFKKSGFALSTDFYYRQFNNIIAYMPGTKFLNISSDPDKIYIPVWEQSITQGKGNAYGAELFLEKRSGQFTGLISYTLSWSKRQFDEINFGKEFYSSYDRRHNFSIFMNYNLWRPKSKKNKIEFSAVWTYSSPNPITLPYATSAFVPYNSFNQFQLAVSNLTLFTDINQIRLRAYHRLDLSIRFIKSAKRERTWEIGVYNVYNRYNPYYYYLDTNRSQQYVLVQKSFFPILPYISYSIKWK